MIFFLRLTGTVFLSALVMIAAAEARHPSSEPKGPGMTRFNDFNKGWGPSFKKLQRALSPERDYVTWIIEEPKIAMDLRSGDLFRRSLYQAPLDTNTISHMMIAWSCHDTDGRRLIGAAAQTGEETEQTKRMVTDGWGMTAFWSEFTDGSLDSVNDFEETFEKAGKEGYQVAHVTFEIKRESCQKMLAFFKGYMNHPHKPYKHFGLTLDPAKFEGGGCGSFASTMLAQAGVLPEVQKLLWRDMRGTVNLMGSGLPSIPENTIIHLPSEFEHRFHYVWAGELLQNSWDTGDGPPMHIVDPEMGILSLRQFALVFARDDGAASARLSKTGFGLRSVQIGVTQAVDESFDPRAAEVVASARAEITARLAAGEKLRPIFIGKYWGLIIAR